VGLVLGIAMSLALGRILNGMLFGVTATDPLTYLAAAVVLAVAAFAACEVPALRATRVDPMVALRTE
jgi:ABC-type antimicrobial peptide transport system permease subunit